MGEVLFDIGEIKIFVFFQTRKFSKMLKNNEKNYNFWKIFKEILRFFENCLKFYPHFRGNLGENLEYGFVGVLG